MPVMSTIFYFFKELWLVCYLLSQPIKFLIYSFLYYLSNYEKLHLHFPDVDSASSTTHGSKRANR